ASPRFALASFSRTAGISGFRSANRLVAATSTTTAMVKVERFCWCCSFPSTVRKTSNSRSARRSNSPFRLLAQPTSGAVRAAWPTSSRLSPRGRHSSSRTRTGEQRFLRLLQRGDGLFLRNRREVLEELRERLARFEIVEERLERHAGSHENRRPAHDLRISMHDEFFRRPHLVHSPRRILTRAARSLKVDADLLGISSEVTAFISEKLHWLAWSVAVVCADEDDLFVGKRISRIAHRSVDVIARELRVGIEQIGFSGTLAQFAQDELHRDPRAANNGFPQHHAGIHFDAISERHEKLSQQDTSRTTASLAASAIAHFGGDRV